MANRKLVRKNNKDILELKEIKGIRFRVMWSNRIAYLFFGMMAFLIMTFQIGSLLKYKSIILDYYELIPLIVVLVPFLLFLNYINRKFLGKVVAVLIPIIYTFNLFE
ncbi:MAG: hypothetical protein E7208_02285 [Clostridium butyricum]|nr:hypothetical protein [Clostridium butyricum]